MDLLERAADRVAQALALVGALGVIALLVHVSADVALRNIADRPIPATNDIASRYYMVAIAFLPLAWVERRDAMVKVELFDFIAWRKLGRATDILVAILVTAIYLTLAYVTWGDAVKNWRIGAFVDVLGRQLAVWPTYFLPPAGFALAGAVTLLRVVSLARSRA